MLGHSLRSPRCPPHPCRRSQLPSQTSPGSPAPPPRPQTPTPPPTRPPSLKVAPLRLPRTAPLTTLLQVHRARPPPAASISPPHPPRAPTSISPSSSPRTSGRSAYCQSVPICRVLTHPSQMPLHPHATTSSAVCHSRFSNVAMYVSRLAIAAALVTHIVHNSTAESVEACFANNAPLA